MVEEAVFAEAAVELEPYVGPGIEFVSNTRVGQEIIRKGNKVADALSKISAVREAGKFGVKKARQTYHKAIELEHKAEHAVEVISEDIKKSRAWLNRINPFRKNPRGKKTGPWTGGPAETVKRRRVRGVGPTPAPTQYMMPASRTVPVRGGEKRYFPFYYGSFRKMPFYRKRFRSRRRRYRRRKRKKYVSLRGVKRMIGNYPYYANNLQVYKKTSVGYVEAGFGQHAAMCVELFSDNTTADANIYDRMFKVDTLMTMAKASMALPTPGTTSVDGPKAGTEKLYVSKSFIKVSYHNPMNVPVEVRIWHLMKKQDGSDATLNPVTVWETEHGEYSSTDVLGVDQWARDMQHGPSQFKQFTNKFKTLKYFKTVFKPGEHKVLNLKLKNFTYTSVDYTSRDMYKNITQYLMMDIRGFITHQDDGATYDFTKIERSKSHLEWLIEGRVTPRLNPNAYNRFFAVDGTQQLVTAGQVLTNVNEVQIAAS